MIWREEDNQKWLEFELLQDYPSLFHRITIKDFDAALPQNISLVESKQVHGKEVLSISGKKEQREGDALVTNKKELYLSIKHADCQAAILYDPIRHVVATVHSGWRGSAQNIYRETISKMKEWYHCSPKDILMCVGPSLGPESAEFIHYQNELPKNFWKYQIKPYYFDFWSITKEQALESGIRPSHIEIACMDTFKLEEFYSSRKDRTLKRHRTIAALL